MSKLTNIVAGIILPVLPLTSGCNITLGVDKEYTNLTKSRYIRTFQEKADQLTKELCSDSLSKLQREEILKKAIFLNGGLGRLEIMDKYINELILLNADSGETYSFVGEKYHKLHKK